MSTSKRIDLICLVGIVVAACITLLMFVFGSSTASGTTMKYESTLFDQSVVHTIDITVDDWEGFLETCEQEEYVCADVTIDGNAVSTVGLRAKGNTSLSSVSQLGSDRYSFKVEFDHYNSVGNYDGLDKLSLNNCIQDSTYMKDYLTYTLMNSFGVDAPLCSYAYITVNGEDWGLYLAVEGIEDSYLERTHNSEGELYKPESMNMGGGRGNGKNFDMNDLMDEDGNFNFDPNGTGNAGTGDNTGNAGTGGSTGNNTGDANTGDANTGGANTGGNVPNFDGGTAGSTGQNGTMPEMPNSNGGTNTGGNVPNFDGGTAGSTGQNGTMPEMPNSSQMPDMSNMDGQDRGNMDFGQGGQGGGMGNAQGGQGGQGMGSDDVKLLYIDDSISSYSNIFDNSKTDATGSDKKRVIAALKTLSEGTDIDSAINIEQVIRYFVVHNFVVNGDSYTGSMIHNYYLYENDGKLSMIPWDYNLSFGTFQGNDASTAVNDAIDSPLSCTGNGDRPMFDFIVQNDEYLALYHQYFAEFLSATDIEALIDQTAELIAPYVEKDPTAFYSYSEFQTGVATLKSFVSLRIQSVQAQLDGSLASNDSNRTDSSNLVDASGINLNSMGTMGGQGGGQGVMGDQGNAGQGNAGDQNAMGDQGDTGQGGMGQGGGAGPGGMGQGGGAGPGGMGGRGTMGA